ncbi:hypothetical protein LX36DRAFT_715594 [Colletotrichum falcatum]|nr:hypothetical protein LX36DRAFT_715594 [Colletotrichum falcatum]
MEMKMDDVVESMKFEGFAAPPEQLDALVNRIEDLADKGKGILSNSITWDMLDDQVLRAQGADNPSVARDKSSAAAASGLVFLPGVIVQGHDWYFLAITRAADERTQRWERTLMGTTQSIQGVYKVTAVLQLLGCWAQDVHSARQDPALGPPSNRDLSSLRPQFFPTSRRSAGAKRHPEWVEVVDEGQEEKEEHDNGGKEDVPKTRVDKLRAWVQIREFLKSLQLTTAVDVQMRLALYRLRHGVGSVVDASAKSNGAGGMCKRAAGDGART